MSLFEVINLEPNKWNFRCSNHRIESSNKLHTGAEQYKKESFNYSLYVNNDIGKLSVPFIYYDIPHTVMAGSEIIFRPALRCESVCSERNIKLAIGRSGGIPMSVLMTQNLPIDTNWTNIELKHEKILQPSIIRLGIYWYDSSPINLILNGENTVVCLKQN
ncbi:hypothetical protein P4594_04695 [Priestia megaterium]|uniref:hypothetical protein n=1 Tax=Priestia megaterium TaxID=1404 RepID=UPI002E1A5FAB|nr:hypothetical protein [Priestia megaterium]